MYRVCKKGRKYFNFKAIQYTINIMMEVIIMSAVNNSDIS